MNKQIALSIEQMDNLVSLGVDTSQASMCWVLGENIVTNKTEYWLTINDEDYFEQHDPIVPAFTLEDMLEILPKAIKEDYLLTAIRIEDMWEISYKTTNSFALLSKIQIRENKSLLQAAYEMLLWVIEKGLLK